MRATLCVQILREKAENRNPDEYYSAMQHGPKLRTSNPGAGCVNAPGCNRLCQPLCQHAQWYMLGSSGMLAATESLGVFCREMTDAQIKALKSQDLLHVQLQSRKRKKVTAGSPQLQCNCVCR